MKKKSEWVKVWHPLEKKWMLARGLTQTGVGFAFAEELKEIEYSSHDVGQRSRLRRIGDDKLEHGGGSVAKTVAPSTKRYSDV